MDKNNNLVLFTGDVVAQLGPSIDKMLWLSNIGSIEKMWWLSNIGSVEKMWWLRISSLEEMYS